MATGVANGEIWNNCPPFFSAPGPDRPQFTLGELLQLASALIGAGIFATFGALEGTAEKAFEATAMLVASAVVTWMLFWMRRQAASLSGELREGIDRALVSAPLLGLGGLAFTAVIREGIETALFLLGQTTAASGEGFSVVLGAAIGLLLASAFYRCRHYLPELLVRGNGERYFYLPEIMTAWLLLAATGVDEDGEPAPILRLRPAIVMQLDF